MLELSLNCSRTSMVCIHSSACSHLRYTFTFVSHSHLYIFMFIYDYVYSIYWHSMTWSPSLSLIHSPWFILCFVFCVSFYVSFCFFVSHRNTAAMRRFASTVHPAKRSGEGSFKENWLSDAGAYPIVVVISFAMVLCGGVGSRCLMANPDVRVLPSKRNSVIRTWDN